VTRDCASAPQPTVVVTPGPTFVGVDWVVPLVDVNELGGSVAVELVGGSVVGGSVVDGSVVDGSVAGGTVDVVVVWVRHQCRATRNPQGRGRSFDLASRPFRHSQSRRTSIRSSSWSRR
jgi:hypothetical protein